eukprot:gene11861-12005_t
MAVPVASSDELPVIDISALTNEGEASTGKAEVAAAIRKACLETGFFYVSGHGISPATLFASVKQLFDLPVSEKQKLDANLSPLHRGYTGIGGSHNCVPDDSSMVGPDQKESFLLGAEGSSSPMHGANTWPSITGWQSAIRTYFQDMLQLSRLVARGIALSLDLPETFFNDKMSDPVAQLLLLKYPPPPAHQATPASCDQQPHDAQKLTADNGPDGSLFNIYVSTGGSSNTQARRSASAAGAAAEDGQDQAAAAIPSGSATNGTPPAQAGFVGCGAHTDCGFLTILAQDDVPGLQVQMPSGQWVVAPAIPGAFLVNLGDMTARWTGDLYKSTLHRVFNSSSQARYSAPFFCNCDFDAVVEPAAMVYSNGHNVTQQPEVEYKAIKAGHYIMQKLGLMWEEGK